MTSLGLFQLVQVGVRLTQKWCKRLMLLYVIVRKRKALTQDYLI
jgi:hypothetical protein